jgi:hypothetical protein
VANVRVPGETHERPCDRFQEEHAALRPLNPAPYDSGQVFTQRASKLFRVRLDTNRYSVPAEYAGARVTIKAYPDRLCVYHQDKLLARHARSFDRHQDIEDPDHPKALLAQRRNAREQRLLARASWRYRITPKRITKALKSAGSIRGIRSLKSWH